MKSFKQFDLNEDGQYTDRFTHQSAEDDNLGLFNVQDEASMQKLNGFVGALADKEYIQPLAAVEQLAMRLGTVGLNFALPKIDSDKGTTVVEVSQFGGRFGKDTDGSDVNDDGVSHKKEGGLKLEFNWEKQSNNTYKVFANLV
jgi:hypothetical protein|tara:strand:+ start:244 stop:672 length:429 start_codon:yes stop_codon:yes gene_type:complete